jgi:hypothetical protein
MVGVFGQPLFPPCLDSPYFIWAYDCFAHLVRLRPSTWFGFAPRLCSGQAHHKSLGTGSPQVVRSQRQWRLLRLWRLLGLLHVLYLDFRLPRPCGARNDNCLDSLPAGRQVRCAQNDRRCDVFCFSMLRDRPLTVDSVRTGPVPCIFSQHKTLPWSWVFALSTLLLSYC